MENFRFSIFGSESKLVKEWSDNVITIEKNSISFIKHFILWNKKSIVYKRKKWDRDIEILILFSKIWKMGKEQRVERIGEKAKPCPIPISMLKNGEQKLFHKYWVFLVIR